MLNITTTPQYERAIKRLKRQHKAHVLTEIKETVIKLANLEITTEKRNHRLSNSNLNDIHIDRGRLILLYRYLGSSLIISLELNNIVNHDQLNRKLR